MAAGRQRPGGKVQSILDLQGAIGNAATARLIQTKLEVGAANDPLEAEADRLADHVVASIRGGGAHATQAVSAAPRAVARAGAGASGAVVGLEGGPAPASAVEAIGRAGGGRPLPKEIQRKAGGALGADLGGVRVHTGAASQQAAQELGATAFTTGKDIHFAAGQYDPGSSAGQALLGHELTHTVQQAGGAQRQVIRRMPSPAAVKARTDKKEKKGTKLFGKKLGATTSYTGVMDALRAHSDYIVRTPISLDHGTLTFQVDEINRLIDRVVAAATTYLGKKDGDPAVVEVCQNILGMAPLDKRNVASVAARFRTNPFGVSPSQFNDPMMSPKWFSQLPSGPGSVKATGESAKGAQKEIAEVTNDTGKVGFFAEDGNDGDYSEAIDHYDEESNTAWQTGKYDGAQGMLESYGQTDPDLLLGARSIAMSRLDTLLKAGVIARTEQALHKDKLGTFQWKAEGKAMREAYAVGEKMDDPNLARLLSRLQLIDTIAGQVDRHAGNYFVQRDGRGKVTGITGIDLDMSFVGTGKDMEFDVERGSRSKRNGGRGDEFPGFSRFVDKELAESIIALQPGDLRAVLTGLLTPDLIDGAVARLLALQVLLKDLQTKGKLLRPNDWQQHLTAIKAERHKDYKNATGHDAPLASKSYYGRDVK